jgi:AraC-like DNA-binding protein
MKGHIVLKTIDYIERNLSNDLSLDEISRSVNYSKYHLSRMFSEKVGYTIYKYIQMRRLTIAAKKLVSTDKSIIEISLEANYDSQQSFTHAFRVIYNQSPQAYRKIGKFFPALERVHIDSNLVYQTKFSINKETMKLGEMAA